MGSTDMSSAAGGTALHSTTSAMATSSSDDGDATASGSAASKKVLRTRTGCLTCRRRKKKCDEERDATTGGCVRCKQAGYQCDGFPTLRSVDPGSDAVPAAKRRRSTMHSCVSPPPPHDEDTQGLSALQAAAATLLDASSPNKPPMFAVGQPLGPPSSSSSFVQPFSPRQRQDSSSTSSGLPSLSGMHSSPAHISNRTPQAAPHTCSFIGECILLGRAICEQCLSTIEPLFSPSDSAAPNMMQTQQQPQQPTPSSSAFSPPSREARHQPVMQSLIGYYSAVLTCWVEGCHPMSIAESPFFRQLVQHLISTIDDDEALRLSVAAVASGYIGGGQLQWPEDLVAIQRWTETLRQETADLVDVTTASRRHPTPPRNPSAADGDRLARHSYIDRHLSKHAMLLYRMAKRAVEEAVQRASRRCSRMRSSEGDDDDDFIGLDEMRKHNNVLLSAMNLCIFSWAELSLTTYYADFEVALQAAHTLFDGVRRVRVAHLNRLDTVGLAVVVWADTCTAIARGTRPFFELHDGERPSQQHLRSPSLLFGFHAFNCPPALFTCLNDLARLRFDCKAIPQRGLLSGGGASTMALSASLAQRAAQVDARLKALASKTQASVVDSDNYHLQQAHSRRRSSPSYTGSPNCSEMTRLAGVLLLYTSVYGKGPLHPACKFALQSIVHLWTYGAIGFCRAVGCSNYLLPMFMASAVACEARDRTLCDEAMNIVGHNEAVADAARKAVREIWRRTDEDGFPVLWTEVVQQSEFQIAFL